MDAEKFEELKNDMKNSNHIMPRRKQLWLIAEVQRLTDKVRHLEDAASSMRNTIHERSIAAQALQKTAERLQKKLDWMSPKEKPPDHNTTLFMCHEDQLCTGFMGDSGTWWDDRGREIIEPTFYKYATLPQKEPK